MPQNVPRPPLQLLDARGADLLQGTLYEDVPGHLLAPLRSWLVTYVDGSPGLADRIALRLRYDTSADTWTTAAHELARVAGMPLLEAVNAALQLDDRLSIEISTEGYTEDPGAAATAAAYDIPAWLDDGGYGWTSNCVRGPQVEHLERLLEDAGSAYTVDWKLPVRLMRRVDPTVVAAAKEAIAADPHAGDLLADAWRKVYGLERDHDPDAAYDDAIRAVEQIACGYVLPKDGAATLGKVIKHFKDGIHGWQYVLSEKDGNRDIVPVIDAMNRLWGGHRGRHGGPDRRPHTVEEARAAVHLAAFLIQALASKAVSRRSP